MKTGCRKCSRRACGPSVFCGVLPLKLYRAWEAVQLTRIHQDRFWRSENARRGGVNFAFSFHPTGYASKPVHQRIFKIPFQINKTEIQEHILILKQDNKNILKLYRSSSGSQQARSKIYINIYLRNQDYQIKSIWRINSKACSRLIGWPNGQLAQEEEEEEEERTQWRAMSGFYFR